ncbi:branched-chain amino acid ABC transporter permease [Thermodesulfobacteriota bacterium]
MTEFFQYILNGISQGCIYALLASGLTLILGILGVPNFAQGHLYMLGAYITFYVVSSFSMSYWMALVMATIALGIVGLIIERLIFRPMEKADEVNLFVASLGLLMVLEGAAVYFFGPRMKWFVTPFSREVLNFAGLALTLQRLIIIVATILIMIAIPLFIKKTALGATLEATAQNREGAMLCGIRVSRVTAMTFAIGTALAGAAGVLIGPAANVVPTMGLGPLLIAFAAVIFGGLGSIAGAVLGAFIMALIESLVAGYLSAAYSEVFIFGIMILVLLFRPMGLFGREVWRP